MPVRHTRVTKKLGRDTPAERLTKLLAVTN